MKQILTQEEFEQAEYLVVFTKGKRKSNNTFQLDMEAVDQVENNMTGEEKTLFLTRNIFLYEKRKAIDVGIPSTTDLHKKFIRVAGLGDIHLYPPHKFKIGNHLDRVARNRAWDREHKLTMVFDTYPAMCRTMSKIRRQINELVKNFEKYERDKIRETIIF